MLLEFGAYNFSSFKEGFEVNLRLDGNCPPEISNGETYVNLLAIKGANASGKTNVLKAYSFLSHFACHSFEAYKPDEELSIDSFFHNENEIELYAIFSHKSKEYEYRIIINDRKIAKEHLLINGKEVLTREYNKLVTSPEFKELRKMPVSRNNASMISLAKQFGFESINTVYELFTNTFSNVTYEGFDAETFDYKMATQHYHKEEKILEFAIDFLKKADTGIEGIFIDDSELDSEKNPIFKPIFTYNVDEKIESLEYSQQSNGTKQLYNLLGLFGFVLTRGGVIVFDELDSHLHADLFKELIGLFNNRELNVGGAQLIFTAHNEDIIDKMKKYRLVFVNKEENESFLYRLDEAGEKIRNDRSIKPLYDSGALGGKPKLSF